MTYLSPCPKKILSIMAPSIVVPPPEIIPPEFWQDYNPSKEPENTFDWAQRYIGAAIDLMNNKNPDKENFQTREVKGPLPIRVDDAYAHLNYIIEDSHSDIRHKQAALAFLMHSWFKIVPPKFREFHAKIVTTD
jgi:hypothetical protein